ncbi:hypothetical protein Naga_100946g3 [Nannochloropsis gaditana]|uniref:Uncharacterized protein n=1 Tax=Nannochloropsis gaditana TaxID=72520 RepID=W7T0E2_9STRA|nr:hypothetical protein Naga_100946g3 [Nannochloropsis gaditana]
MFLPNQIKFRLVLLFLSGSGSLFRVLNYMHKSTSLTPPAPLHAYINYNVDDAIMKRNRLQSHILWEIPDAPGSESYICDPLERSKTVRVRVTAGDPPVLTKHLYRPYNGDRHYPPSHPSVQNLSEYGSMYLINNKDRFFSTLDLNTLPKSGADKPVLFMASNRGRVFRLFDNPYHRRQLYDVGLRPETAFACGFRFLFAPNEVTRDETGWQLAEEHLIPLHYSDDEETEKEAMLEARNTLRIGIQIRVGDFVFNQPA